MPPSELPDEPHLHATLVFKVQATGSALQAAVRADVKPDCDYFQRR